jgi:hypothetical protein
MSDANSGAAILATTPAAPAAPAATPAAPGAAPAAPPASSWYGEPHKGLVESKGWKTPDDALQSYRGLEQLLGANADKRGVVLPKDDTDAAGWDAVYTKLGRPEKPEGYKLPMPEGADPAFAKQAAEVMHKFGLTQKQAEGLAAWNNEQGAALFKDQDAKREAAFKTEFESLKTEWGQGFDSNVQLGQRAAKAFGFGKDELAKIEEAIGPGALLKRFAEVGKRLGEDVLPGDRHGGGEMGLTPAAAKENIAQLQRDPAFVKDLTDNQAPGHADAVAKWDKLHKAAYS